MEDAFTLAVFGVKTVRRELVITYPCMRNDIHHAGLDQILTPHAHAEQCAVHIRSQLVASRHPARLFLAEIAAGLGQADVARQVPAILIPVLIQGNAPEAEIVMGGVDVAARIAVTVTGMERRAAAQGAALRLPGFVAAQHQTVEITGLAVAQVSGAQVAGMRVTVQRVNPHAGVGIRGLQGHVGNRVTLKHRIDCRVAGRPGIALHTACGGDLRCAVDGSDHLIHPHLWGVDGDGQITRPGLAGGTRVLTAGDQLVQRMRGDDPRQNLLRRTCPGGDQHLAIALLGGGRQQFVQLQVVVLPAAADDSDVAKASGHRVGLVRFRIGHVQRSAVRNVQTALGRIQRGLAVGHLPGADHQQGVVGKVGAVKGRVAVVRACSQRAVHAQPALGGVKVLRSMDGDRSRNRVFTPDEAAVGETGFSRSSGGITQHQQGVLSDGDAAIDVTAAARHAGGIGQRAAIRPGRIDKHPRPLQIETLCRQQTGGIGIPHGYLRILAGRQLACQQRAIYAQLCGIL
ncbi:hypothetical protein D3C75_638460 [compost metagenome]